MKFFLAIAALVSSPIFAAKVAPTALRLWSPDVTPGSTIAEKHVFNGFGCSGTNVSPALRWEAPPAGTKAWAVTMYDPDAPTGSGWWHWLVYNLPAETMKLDAGAGDAKAPKLPAGAAHGRTDFGSQGYGGPCPPKGDRAHRYVFTLFALKEKVDVPADATAALIGFQLNAKAIERATFTAAYGR